MAHDEDLANRIRELLADVDDVTERVMFGGLAFLVGGHMAIVASGSGGVLARIGPEAYDAAIARPDVSEFVMRDRPMLGWVRVSDDGVRTKRALEPWVRCPLMFVRALPKR